MPVLLLLVGTSYSSRIADKPSHMTGHMTGHILLTQENAERGFIIRFKPRKTGSCLEKLFEMGFYCETKIFS